jgi:hypothetical protein
MKEAIDYSSFLSQYLPADTEENHGRFHRGQRVSEPRFELRTLRI